MFQKNKAKFKACNNVCNFSCCCVHEKWKSDRKAPLCLQTIRHILKLNRKIDKHMNVTHKKKLFNRISAIRSCKVKSTDEEANKRKNKIKIAHRMSNEHILTVSTSQTMEIIVMKGNRTIAIFNIIFSWVTFSKWQQHASHCFNLLYGNLKLLLSKLRWLFLI